MTTTIEKSNQLAEVQAVYKYGNAPSDRQQITSTIESVKYLRSVWETDRMEYTEDLLMLLLNTSNQVLGWTKISQGGIHGTVCDAKVIFTIALVSNARGIILAHNHPSGNLKPSEADIAVCRKIKEGAQLLDIKFLDNLIITTEGYYSFAEEGLML